MARQSDDPTDPPREREQTDAEQAGEWIAADWRAIFTTWREAGAHVPRLRDRWAQFDAVDSPDDFMTAALREVFDPILDSVVWSRPERQRRHLTIRGMRADFPTAGLSIRQDGSGLVVIADGMFGLLMRLAQMTSIWWHDRELNGSWRAAFRFARAIQRLDSQPELVTSLTAALRWNLIHLRGWGNSAALAFDPDGSDETNFADYLAQESIAFVVAHEVAHFSLGHHPEQIGNPQIEHQADAVAMETMLRRSREHQMHPLFAWAGARLALIAAEIIERALFVRAPTTHPTSKSRWDAMVAGRESQDGIKRATLATTGLARASAVAIDPLQSFDDNWWTGAYEHRRIHTDVHDGAYYTYIGFFDRLSFGTPDDPYNFLISLRENDRFDAVPVAEEARSHGLRRGLELLGGLETDELTDPCNPVSYFSLITAIHQSELFDAAPNATGRRMAAIALGTLLGGVERKLF